MVSERAKRLVEAVLATKDHYEAQEIAEKFLEEEREAAYGEQALDDIEAGSVRNED